MGMWPVQLPGPHAGLNALLKFLKFSILKLSMFFENFKGGSIFLFAPKIIIVGPK